MRVLLVEDDLELSTRLKSDLGRAGYAIDTADNGVDAQHLGEQEPYDAVILEARQTVHREGSVLELTGVEFRLLRYFMLHPGEVMSKTRLTEHVYEYDAERDSNVIEVYITNVWEFRERYALVSVVILAALIALQTGIVRASLRPLRQVREDLACLERGEVQRINSEVPTEIVKRSAVWSSH